MGGHTADALAYADDQAVHAALTATSEWEAEETARAAFEEQRAFEEWRTARLYDDPDIPEAEVTMDAYADWLLAGQE